MFKPDSDWFYPRKRQTIDKRGEVLIFFCDLDNTLIHSYKRAAEGDVCVEIHEGRTLSYMRPQAYTKLQEVNKLVEFVPVTTRTAAQYRRLSLIAGQTPRWALVSNGAILLRNGELDKAWQAESSIIFRDCIDRLPDYAQALKAMPDYFWDVRIADEFFIFAKHTAQDEAGRMKSLENLVDSALFDLRFAFEKLYIMPKGLDKGAAVKRLLNLLGGAQFSVSAGDSILDLPMLNATDRALVPYNFAFSREFDSAPDEHFAEYILQNILNWIDETRLSAL